MVHQIYQPPLLPGFWVPHCGQSVVAPFRPELLIHAKHAVGLWIYDLATHSVIVMVRQFPISDDVAWNRA